MHYTLNLHILSLTKTYTLGTEFSTCLKNISHGSADALFASYLSGESQTIGDFAVSRPSQSSPAIKNHKSQISPIIQDGRGRVGKIETLPICPNRDRQDLARSGNCKISDRLGFPDNFLAFQATHLSSIYRRELIVPFIFYHSGPIDSRKHVARRKRF